MFREQCIEKFHIQPQKKNDKQWFLFKTQDKPLLSTGDRMRTWGIAQVCGFCGERNETRDHLFFACPYSYTIWESLARPLVGRNINPDWEWTVNRLRTMGEKTLDSILARMLFQTAVYYVRKERNSRCHQQRGIQRDQLRRLIDKAVRNRICSLRYTHGHRLEGLLRRWFQVTLQHSICLSLAPKTLNNF